MNTIVVAPDAPAAIGPYSHAVIRNGILMASGQIGQDPADGKLVAPDVAAQTRQCLKNLEAVLRAAGGHWDNVVKVNIYLVDMDDFAAMNEEYKRWFPNGYPARCCVAVAGMAPGARVEIDLMAVLDRN